MVTYSVTVSIDLPLQHDWLSWMQREHIPDVMGTGFFEDFVIRKLVEPAPEAGSMTYNIQYRCLSHEHLQRYLKTAAPRLREEIEMRYKGRYVAFRTILEDI